MVECCCKQGPDLHPEPAQSVQRSADGRRYTTHPLRRVMFHNGREMTAADVKYSFERVLDPKSKSEGALDRRPASPDEARQILGLRGREAGQVPLVQVRRKGGLETTAIKPDLAHQ